MQRIDVIGILKLGAVLFTTVSSTIIRTHIGNCDAMKSLKYTSRVRLTHSEDCLSCITFNQSQQEVWMTKCEAPVSSRNPLEPFNDVADPFRRNFRYGDRKVGLKLILTSKDIPMTELSYKWQASVLSYLWILDLSDNFIINISPPFFDIFSSLKGLNLANNKLSSIDGDIFLPLKYLQKLNYSQNQLSNIESNNLKYLLNLFEIDLSFNNISHIPKNIFTNQLHLELVLLNNNNLVHFDATLPRISLSILPTIDLSNNKLDLVVLPENYLNLNLSNNKLLNFTYIVSSSAQSLNLSYNSITEIRPLSFLNASKLINLDLSHNLISTIPSNSFRNVKLLQYVDISHNLMRTNTYGSDNNLISFFLYFRNLKEVALNGNFWQCSDLKDILYSLIYRNVNVIEGNTHNTSNILGIACSDADSKSNSNCTASVHGEISEFHKAALNNMTEELSLQVKEIRAQLDDMTSNSNMSTNSLWTENLKEEINGFKKSILNYTTLQTNLSQMESKIKITDELSYEIKNIKNQLDSMASQINTSKPPDKKIIDKMLLDHIESIINNKFNNMNRTFLVKNKFTSDEVASVPNEKLASLLRDSVRESSAKTGNVITNILLFLMLCTFTAFIYFQFKNKRRQVTPLEEIQLV